MTEGGRDGYMYVWPCGGLNSCIYCTISLFLKGFHITLNNVHICEKTTDERLSAASE